MTRNLLTGFRVSERTQFPLPINRVKRGQKHWCLTCGLVIVKLYFKKNFHPFFSSPNFTAFYTKKLARV